VLRYALRRLISLVSSLVVASLVIFLTLQVVPGDPAGYMLDGPELEAAVIGPGSGLGTVEAFTFVSQENGVAHLVVVADADSENKWVEIFINGMPHFSGTLMLGENHIWLPHDPAGFMLDGPEIECAVIGPDELDEQDEGAW